MVISTHTEYKITVYQKMRASNHGHNQKMSITQFIIIVLVNYKIRFIPKLSTNIKILLKLIIPFQKHSKRMKRK